MRGICIKPIGRSNDQFRAALLTIEPKSAALPTFLLRFDNNVAKVLLYYHVLEESRNSESGTDLF
jgi:hypothetical protein